MLEHFMLPSTDKYYGEVNFPAGLGSNDNNTAFNHDGVTVVDLLANWANLNKSHRESKKRQIKPQTD